MTGVHILLLLLSGKEFPVPGSNALFSHNFHDLSIIDTLFICVKIREN